MITSLYSRYPQHNILGGERDACDDKFLHWDDTPQEFKKKHYKLNNQMDKTYIIPSSKTNSSDALQEKTYSQTMAL